MDRCGNQLVPNQEQCYEFPNSAVRLEVPQPTSIRIHVHICSIYNVAELPKLGGIRGDPQMYTRLTEPFLPLKLGSRHFKALPSTARSLSCFLS